MAKRRGRGELAGGVAGIASAGLSIGAASGGVGVAAGALGVVAGLPGAVRAVYAAFQARQDERIQKLLSEAYFENAADEGFASYVAGLLEDPRTRRVLLETVRTVLESVCDETLPALACMMREYERTRTEPDARFRGVCRVLQELSPGEYSSLRALLRLGSSDPGLRACETVAFVLALNEQARTRRVVAAGVNLDMTLHLVAVAECDPDVFARLSHLLYVHHLGDKLGLGAVGLTDETVHDEVRLSSAFIRWVAGFLAK